MTDVVVAFLLAHVNELLEPNHPNFTSDAVSDLELLRDDLCLLKGFLQDEARKSKKEESLRELERQIREVVYEVEDAIDNFFTMVTVSSGKSIKRFISPKSIQLAKLVKSLREDKLKPLFDKNPRIKVAKTEIRHRPSTSTNVQQTRTKLNKTQYSWQDNIVGFEDEEKTIIKYLMEQKKELDVISIIGMPGLGKTTLARKIYHNQKIRSEFPICIWVNVYKQFNIRDVFLKILQKFTSQDMSGLGHKELADSARACLHRERYFLVIDGLWSVEDWNTIKDVLPHTNGKGKVLITSREDNVGSHASVNRKPHMMRCLTEDESWKLLQLQVFGNLKDCPQELKRVGERIAKQCGGVPLTIMVAGGILADEFTKTRDMDVAVKRWVKVFADGDLFFQKDKNRISDVVELSYNTLPGDLKECFLYLGVFPEDHEIPAWTLTRLWIAEGFIQPATKGKSLEQTAEENLYELINRKLLMVDRIDPTGEVKTCRVHDMIREFCISKAVDQKLFLEVKLSEKGIFNPSVSKVQEFRRVCFHSNLTEFLSQKPEGPHLRSFLCFPKEHAVLEQEYTPMIPDTFKLLRVLDSKSIQFNKLDRSFTRLIHLRYVTLYVGDLSILPATFSKLWNLQTLVVKTNKRSITMEANIWRMIQLRHLKTSAAIVLDTKPREGEAAGENLQLQTLTTLSPDSFNEDVSKRVRDLKSLGFRGKIATLLNSKVSLKILDGLEKLKLMNDMFNESTSSNLPHSIPQSKFFPPCLKRLTLSGTSFNWKDMSILAKIGTLEVLKLKDNAFTGITWNVVDDVFGSLKFLLIANADLVIWKASTNSFPSLRCLVLVNCQQLQEIPVELAKNLKKLDIDRLRKSAVDSARKIEAEKQQATEGGRGDRFELSIGQECDELN